ncbi:DUF6651 domain-containing protein [Pseudomonas costantinii]|uniref:DUF6651 domain-containing protein n=1 Tax=Pseudomonas costantinii TaxID=168469 RepID=A0A1S2UED8_9PSED|nr:DUF6651 domain-containing protein [Pseudomonas costantinii]OIN44520.1 hypothetical protein BFL40_29985 [Pseudomonas costantinii]SED26613.1 hypothetical protein SAMN04515675_0489 [Pseudomonas costantinii]
MKLKIDEEGHVVVVDGKPVYVSDDGKDVAFDAQGTVATISRLNAEAKTNRERAEGAEGALKAFEGIADPAEARKALETIKNFDAKKLVDAGEVEKVRAEAIKAVEEKYAPIVAERDSLNAALVTEKVGGSFDRSKFITDKLAIPSDLVRARFGEQFKVEDGKVVAYDKTGNKLFSRSNPGEIANFDEALELLVDSYPYRDQILKSSGASGGGASGGAATGGAQKLSRAQFEALPPAKQMEHVKAGAPISD